MGSYVPVTLSYVSNSDEHNTMENVMVDNISLSWEEPTCEWTGPAYIVCDIMEKIEHTLGMCDPCSFIRCNFEHQIPPASYE